MFSWEMLIAGAVLTSWIATFWAGYKYGFWAVSKAKDLEAKAASTVKDEFKKL